MTTVEIKEQCALLRWQIELRHAAVSKVIRMAGNHKVLPWVEATGTAFRSESLCHDEQRVGDVVSPFREEVHPLIGEDKHMVVAIILRPVG